MIDTAKRSTASEIMDDFAMTGALLTNTLDQIATINQWLGGNRVTLDGVNKVLSELDKKKPIRIIDLGCGNGDQLRSIARLGRKKGYHFQLIGIDANSHTVDYARLSSIGFPEITYMNKNVFDESFKSLKCDIMLATLFLHHFSDKDCEALLAQLNKQTSTAIIVNDLERNALAYYLFKGVCLFITNTMVKNDGLISILRGFKRKELTELSEKLGLAFELNWKWAFRFQWIIKTK